ncbi:MAG: response regulator transcription factor [Bacteroidetes bacterium]|jgi:DNA-binding NarL/FixJ family response regulator|nr:response regulator transcription factor [Bacteroidota bacterium]MBS1979860.1 response regulator transcription factor [Bacteroidota bacterium]
MKTPVLIFEDNDLLRESICSMLSLDNRFEMAGAFGTGRNVLELMKEFNPGIILMDIDMPGLNGIDAVSKIRQAGWKTPVLMLTVFDDTRHVFDAICAGASGYLLKKHLSSRLFSAIEELQSGGAPMSPSIASMVIQSMYKKPAQNKYSLTTRETEILTSLSKGNSYKLVANDLEISIDTVRTHIKNVYEKLQVHSQAEAIAKAIHERLV